MLQNIFSHRPPLYNVFDKAELYVLHAPWVYCFYYRPQTKSRKGNVFTGVFLSTGSGQVHHMHHRIRHPSGIYHSLYDTLPPGIQYPFPLEYRVPIPLGYPTPFEISYPLSRIFYSSEHQTCWPVQTLFTWSPTPHLLLTSGGHHLKPVHFIHMRPYPPVLTSSGGQRRWRYASYWNAFLLQMSGLCQHPRSNY